MLDVRQISTWKITNPLGKKLETTYTKDNKQKIKSRPTVSKLSKSVLQMAKMKTRLWP